MTNFPKHIQNIINIIESQEHEFTVFIDSNACYEVDMEEQEFLCLEGSTIKFSEIDEDSMDWLVQFKEIEKMSFPDDIQDYSKIIKHIIKNQDELPKKQKYCIIENEEVVTNDFEEYLSLNFIFEKYESISLGFISTIPYLKVLKQLKLEK